MAPRLEYQDRLLAFVDVLGFSALTIASATDPAALSKISALVDIDKLFQSFHRNVLKMGQTSIFSDTFVLSMDVERAWYLFRETGLLCRHMLLQGLPCRGAITSGLLYHVDGVVVGPAMVEAHRLETQVANWPRVVVDDAAMRLWVRECRPDGSLSEHRALVKRGPDGQEFLDLFHPDWAEVFVQWPDDEHRLDHFSFLNAAHAEIEAGRRANEANDSVRSKYEWLARECSQRLPPV